jgi:hypothetical protein
MGVIGATGRFKGYWQKQFSVVDVIAALRIGRNPRQ